MPLRFRKRAIASENDLRSDIDNSSTDSFDITDVKKSATERAKKQLKQVKIPSLLMHVMDPNNGLNFI